MQRIFHFTVDFVVRSFHWYENSSAIWMEYGFRCSAVSCVALREHECLLGPYLNV